MRATWKYACLPIDWFVGLSSGELLLKMKKRERERERQREKEKKIYMQQALQRNPAMHRVDDNGCCTRLAINSAVPWHSVGDVINDNRSNINLAHVSQRGPRRERKSAEESTRSGRATSEDSALTACRLARHRRCRRKVSPDARI